MNTTIPAFRQRSITSKLDLDKPLDPFGGEGPAANPGASQTWTSQQLLDSLFQWSGGRNLYNEATQANGGNNPTITLDPNVPSGRTDPNNGTIQINPGKTLSQATQTLIQELSNLAHKADVVKVSKEAFAGNVSRQEYIRRLEEIEYQGVKTVISAYDATKDKWNGPCAKEWARNAKNFDDYFDNYFLNDSHKGNNGNWWDSHYKTAYDSKHAPPSWWEKQMNSSMWRFTIYFGQ